MATNDSVTQLISNIAGLSYSEATMASTPLRPFVATDTPRLTVQATTLARQDIALRPRNPATLIQSSVDNANGHVITAQNMFSNINNNPTNTYNATTVFDTVNSAINAITAV